MGCTSSRETGHHASSPPARSLNIGLAGGDLNAHGDPSSSSQAIVDRAASPSRTTHTNGTDGRPNQPLRPPSPVLSSPANLTLRPWTPSELTRQREAFFETRVTGSAEVWAALKLVCDMLRLGNVAGAQGVLDATGLTCPTGRVVGDRQSSRSGRTGKKGGVYDDRGVLYDIPAWIVADPQDLVEEEPEEADEKVAELDGQDGQEKIVMLGAVQEEDIGEVVKVKARLSGRETDVIVSVGMEQRLAVVAQKIRDKAGVQKIRLAHMGKMLGEKEKLSETGWAPGHVLNAFVFE